MATLLTRVVSARTFLTLAAHVLAGEIAARRGDIDAAVAHLKTAVRMEDGLKYVESPDWGDPVRLTLGDVLLHAGRPAEAEAVDWENLRRHPENGWALHGLWRSLLEQGERERAEATKERFEKAWAGADIELGDGALVPGLFSR